MLNSVNILAVLVATIIGYVIPMIWYAPGVFGKAWMKYAGIKEMKMNAKVMILGFLIGFVFNYVIGLVVGFSEVSTIVDGMIIGFVLWLGLIATSQLDSVLYAKKPINLYWIVSRGRNIGCLEIIK